MFRALPTSDETPGVATLPGDATVVVLALVVCAGTCLGTAVWVLGPELLGLERVICGLCERPGAMPYS